MKKILCFFLFIFNPVIQSQIFSSELPTIDGPIFIQEWQYAGPFETGAREGVVDPLYPWGYNQPENGYPSAFSENARVEWKSLTGSEDGKVSLKISNAPWQVLNESWGIVGINYVTYVKGSFYSDRKYKAKISAKQVRSFNLNGRNILADFYNLNRWEPPIIIDSGYNEIVLSLNSYSDSIGFVFSILPDVDVIRVIENDITFPDAVEQSFCDGWIGIPLVNCSDEWLKNVTLIIGGDEYYSETNVENVNILPLCVTKVPIKLKSIKNFPAVSDNKEKNILELPIIVKIGDVIIKESSLKIPLKKHNEDRQETFLSKIDNSVQFYGIKEPIDYDPSKNYGLIFSLHGASVNALGQVGAYAPRNWAFVVAPTNRREFGFNWHEQGRIDAMEVLEIVKQRYKLDSTRIMLTGHSMGGHGVWHIGTLYADKFAAIASACGWMSIDLYFPMFLTKYSTFAPPKLKYIWELGYAADRPQLYLNNLYNTPTLILAAGADDNVPPVHGRLFAEEMRKLGMNPELHDMPNKPHWYDDDTTRPGADVTDAQFFEDFYQGKVLNTYPDTVKFVMGDPSVKDRMYWVKITGLEKEHEPAEIKAIHQADNEYILTSKNVLRVEIQCKEKKKQNVTVKWNGKETFNFQSDVEGKVRFTHAVLDSDFKEFSFNYYSDLTSGPMKKAYMSPFVIVIGSHTDKNTFDSYLQAARQEALSWWYVANGYIEIITDTEATTEKTKDKNLILIGTSDDNKLMKKMIESTPIHIIYNEIMIGKKHFSGESSIKFIYPNPDDQKHLVLFSTGTSSEYAVLSEAFIPFSVFSALPDWMLFDNKVRQYGFAGVKAAGYFDMNWQFDENLSYY